MTNQDDWRSDRSKDPFEDSGLGERQDEFEAENDPFRDSSHDPEDYADILAEVVRLQNKKASWFSTILILLFSGVIFFAIGGAAWSWKLAGMLIPILAFHEMGHYLAMLVFKYRNMRMFFIPFLGAAVSGQNYNVAGWKKAVVALMGPVPGICAGIVLGIVGYFVDQKLLIEAAALTVFLNGFNLLPVLPLDGGWVLHATLFSRHWILDIGFRVIAALLLTVGGLALGGKFLMYFGIAMLFGIPLAYRTAKVADRLRGEGWGVHSGDAQTIPLATAIRIIDELRELLTGKLKDKQIAQLTLQTFERMNATPPGVLATIALVGVHFFAFIFSVVFALIFFLAQHADLKDVFQQAAIMPTNVYDCGEMAEWRGPQVTAFDKEPNVITATFASHEKAEDAFAELTAKLPPNSLARVFGQSVFVTLPADQALLDNWVHQIEMMKSVKVQIDDDGFHTTWTMVCIAPSGKEAERIRKEVEHYFQLSNQCQLIPPWSTRHGLTPEQRKVRETWTRLRNAEFEIYKDPRMVERTNKRRELMRALGRRGAQKGPEADERRRKLVEFDAEQVKLQTQIRDEMFAEIARKDPNGIDLELIALYKQQPRFRFSEEGEDDEPIGKDEAKKRDDEWRAWNLQIGARMGQLPLENGEPRNGENGESVTGGFPVQTGLLLRFQFLNFDRVDEGVPALAKWLCSQRCLDIKYGLESSDRFDGEIWDE